MNKLINILKLSIIEFIFNFFGSKGVLKKLKTQTVSINQNILSNQYCESLREKIAQLIENDCPDIWSDSKGSDIRIWQFEKYLPDLKKELNIKNKISAIESYLGQNVEDWMIMANRLNHVENNEGSGGGVHRDSAFSHQIKYIWYLSNVKDDSGPFSYLPNSNTYSLKNVFSDDFGKTRLQKNTYNLSQILGTQGTEIICDTRAIHGGKPIESGKRYAATLYTFTKKGYKKKMLDSMGI